MAAVNGDLRGRRRQQGELAHPALMVGGSSSNSVLEYSVLEDTEF
jgi:hypothetical protein